jgi:hypothetical protein
LLRTLRHVGRIGERDVIGEFLFDGDLGAVADGIGFCGEPLRIDFDIAGAEQPLEPVANRAIQRLIENKGSGLIGKNALPGLRLKLRGLIAGATESEQCDDVGFWQRRFRTVVDIQSPVGRAGDRNIEVVVADVSGGLKIELGFNGNRIGEIDISAIESVPRAMKGRLTFDNGDRRHRIAAR